MTRPLVALLFLTLGATHAFAQSSGGAKGNWGLGLFGGITTATQGDMQELQKRDNTRGGVPTPAFGNALEFGALIERRLNGSAVSLQLRPSYFTHSSKTDGGSGANAGTYAYDVTGYIIMPLLRLFILESKGIKLYLQGGVGWATLKGKIQENTYTNNFSGSNFGFQGGLGVEFCLGTGTHCFFTEGNVRYMSVERNIVSDTTGTVPSNSAGGAKGQEVEIDGRDLATSASGVQALLGYMFHF